MPEHAAEEVRLHRPLIRAQLPRIEREPVRAACARVHDSPGEQAPGTFPELPRPGRFAKGGGGHDEPAGQATREVPTEGRAAAPRGTVRRCARPAARDSIPARSDLANSRPPSHSTLRRDRLILESMTDLSGKCGLVVGVANKRSIAWAIAQALSAIGRTVRPHLSERATRRKRARACRDARQSADSAVRRLERSSRSTRSARSLDKEFGGLGLSRAWRRVRARRRARRAVFADAAAKGFASRSTSAPIRSSRSRANRAPVDAETRRRQHPHADLSGQRARLQELQRDGCGEGGAGVVCPLPGRRARAGQHPRERDLRRARSRHSPPWAFRVSRAFSASIASGRRSGATSIRRKWPTPRCFCSARRQRRHGRGDDGRRRVSDVMGFSRFQASRITMPIAPFGIEFGIGSCHCSTQSDRSLRG